MTYDYPRENKFNQAPKCGRCNGTGSVWVKGKPKPGGTLRRTKVVCTTCQGTGFRGGREP